MNIPFFDYPRAYLDDREEILAVIDEVASRGAFILQKELSDFESNLSNYSGSTYAVGVANGTDALELAWMAAGLKPGDEVIMSAHTMLATASSVKLLGGVPVPVDIGPDWMIDPEAISAAITDRTFGIMPTQLNGRTCDMDSISKIASANDLVIIEDSAQGLGSCFRGQMAGTFGAAGTYSFYPAKVLGSLGDGGAVLTSDPDMFEKVYQLHEHGRDLDGKVRCWGRNSRLDNIQAAILDIRLKRFDEVIARRRAVAGLYNDLLNTVPSIVLPPAPDADDKHFDTYQNYEICAEERDKLKDHLARDGIGTIIQWGGKGIHQFESLDLCRPLENADRFFDKCLLLPMNTFISDGDVELVCKSIKEFYGSN